MGSLHERIQIINEFDILYSNKNKSIEKRLRINSIFLFLNIVLIFASSIGIFTAIIVEVAGIESRFNWSRTSLFVLLSFNFLNAICNEFYKKLLLGHLKFLETSADADFNENLNNELTKMVAAINKPKRNNIVIVSLGVIVLFGATANLLMDYQFRYYNLFIIPTLLFYALTILNVVKTYRKIKTNIDEVEAS